MDYYFIIGADMVDYLPKWYRIDELVDMVQFVEFSVHATRQETSIQLSGWMCLSWIFPPAWYVTSLPKVGKPFLLTSASADYIEKEGLY